MNYMVFSVPGPGAHRCFEVYDDINEAGSACVQLSPEQPHMQLLSLFFMSAIT